MTLSSTRAGSRGPTSLALEVRRSVRSWTSAELVRMSSASTLRTAVRRGEVVRVLPDQYVADLHQGSYLARARAALRWAGPTSTLSGPGAMHLWGMLPEPPDTIDLLLPHPTHHQKPPWLRIRRISWDPPVTRMNGMHVVSASHAVALAYGRLPKRDRASRLYRALATELISPESVLAAIEAIPRLAARQELCERVQAAADGAESYLEEQGLRRVFNTKEFSSFTRQHWITVGTERFRADMFDAATLTDIEMDGDEYHESTPDRKRDIRRDALLASVGILTVRLSYADIIGRRDWCRERVRAILAARDPAKSTLAYP